MKYHVYSEYYNKIGAMSLSSKLTRGIRAGCCPGTQLESKLNYCNHLENSLSTELTYYITFTGGTVLGLCSGSMMHFPPDLLSFMAQCMLTDSGSKYILNRQPA